MYRFYLKKKKNSIPTQKYKHCKKKRICPGDYMGKYPRFTTIQENNAEYRIYPKYPNLSRGLYGENIQDLQHNKEHNAEGGGDIFSPG